MTPYVHNAALVPPGTAPVGPSTPAAAPQAPQRPGTPSFADVLRREQVAGGVQFSRHALERVQRRGIDVQPATLERLQTGVERAQAKGARDAVVFVDGTAFVVSVSNKTVITAVDPEHMREHVFTNIDSAVIA